MTWIQRTAYPRLPRTVSVRDFDEVFRPTEDEVEWTRGRTQSDAHLLGLMLLLKCFQRLSYFPRLDTVPTVLVDQLRVSLGIPETVTPVYAVDRTGKRHRAWVRRRLGVVWEPMRVRAIAEAAMREALLGKDNPADVINVAVQALVENRCELPGYSTLDEMAAALRAQVNGGFYRLVSDRLDAAERARILGLLVVDPRTRQSLLPRLTQAAPKATITRLKAHVELLGWLDEIGPTATWLAEIPPAKIEHFAGEAGVLDADEFSGVGEAKRLTLLVCLVHLARTRARDEVATMFCKRMAAIAHKARERLEELRAAHRAESERLLGVFGDVLAGVRDLLGPDTANDLDAGENLVGEDTVASGVGSMGSVAERAGRMVLKTFADAGGVAELPGAHEAVSAHHGNNHTPLMERYYRSHRSTLFALLEVLELESTSTDQRVLEAVAVLRANRHRIGEYIPISTRASRSICRLPGNYGATPCAIGAGPAGCRAGTSRCACSPTWPPSWAPAISPSSARSPTRTCTPS